MYQPQFYELLAQAGKDISQLPGSLRAIVKKFEAVTRAMVSDSAESRRWGSVLLQTDAFISAKIAQRFGVLPLRVAEEAAAPADQLKIMALKAKALQLKWKMRED